MKDSIGIDISKDKLDFYRLSDGATESFDNTKTGIAELRRWIGSAAPARLVYEGQTMGLTARITVPLNAFLLGICRWLRSTLCRPAALRRRAEPGLRQTKLPQPFWRRWAYHSIYNQMPLRVKINMNSKSYRSPVPLWSRTVSDF